jgi:hypothetical protein
MQVITSVNDLKTKLPKNKTAAITGFTRSYPIGPNHDHVVSYTLNSPLDYTLGIMWDNKYDLSLWRGLSEFSPTVWDQAGTITWFQNKGFDFLFIPEADIMQRMLSLSIATQVRNQVEQICTDENYDMFLPVWEVGMSGDEAYRNSHSQNSWIRLMMFRMLILYTVKTGAKFISRGDSFSGPDFTLGYIFKHFVTNHIGGNATIVPVYRNADGTVYDHYTNSYPQDAKDMILALTPLFAQFRDDYDFSELVAGVQSLFDNSLDFRLVGINEYYDLSVVPDFVWNTTFMRRGVSSVATGNTYRMWEYANGA